MANMNCKLKKDDGSVCGVQIDYNPDAKKATNMDGSPHLHAKKKFFTSKQAMPIETELELQAKVTGLEERIDKLETAVKALVAEVEGLTP